ncbi:MAG: tRNA-modifying protein YgfZ, partial [Pseudomonadota bacterium]
ARLGWRIYGGDGPDRGVRAGYDALRVALTVPEAGAELLPDETFILEAGFERLHGVDFRKGCYVGQEVTARMKHKTTLRKGLVQVAVEGSADPGTEIVAGSGKPAGKLFTQAGGLGLAHLRFDRAGVGMRAGDAEVSYAG